MRSRDAAFDDWVARAREHDILDAAHALGAVLKRSGQEWVGPCAIDGGVDRFCINQRKQVFICRGSAGGDVIALTEHLLGCDFVKACEYLNNEPPPRGSREESDEDRRKREKLLADRKREAERRQASRDRQQESYEEFTRKAAREIWQASEPIAVTLAEAYLRKRGIDYELAFPSLRYNESVLYKDANGKSRHWPALVCCVQGPDMKFLGIWRIFLDPAGKGNKGRAPVTPDKAALGPVLGGAVWLGKPGPEIKRCEGVETGLGIYGIGRLVGRETPVACCMSTSGLVGFQRPPCVTRDAIYPDADCDRLPDEKHPSGMRSPGIRAAVAASARAAERGQPGTTIQPSAPHNQDFLDVYCEMRKEAYGI